MSNSFLAKFLGVLVSVLGISLTSLACETGEYLVTAYYSPAPNQPYFLTGSYASEIRLNGKGLYTASTEPVSKYKYMFVAADPCFAFGTKVDLDQLGTYYVLDRGGAIKDKRIDLWFGFGEQARRAAKLFGRQYIWVDINSSRVVNASANFRKIKHYFSELHPELVDYKARNSEYGFSVFDNYSRYLDYVYFEDHTYHKKLLKYSDHLR